MATNRFRKLAFWGLLLLAVLGLSYEVTRALLTPKQLTSVAQRQAYDKKTVLELRRRLVASAERYLGRPYLFGGTDQDKGFDCSGLVQAVYATVGFSLPHGAQAQFHKLYKTENAEPGDLVFFRREGVTIEHVGILIDDDLFIHAPSSGKKISYARLSHPYFKERYVAAATIFPP